MKAVMFSVIFCIFCIHQCYSLSLPEPVPDVYKNHAACLAEQDLDLSVFGASNWNELDKYDHFAELKNLEEGKRNVLLACLLHHKPLYGINLQIIHKKEDGTYDFNAKYIHEHIINTCKEYERDLNKFAGCYYNNEKFHRPGGFEKNE